MSVNLYSKLSHDPSYKLVQLTPDLLEALKTSPGSEIKFKALNNGKSDVVLCSQDKTWLVRQKNHSNTVLIMREFVPEDEKTLDERSLFGMPQPTNDLLGFSRTTFEYETKPTKGLVNVELLPMYNGEPNFPENEVRLAFKNFNELLDDSPASEKESRVRWSILGGCLINGFPCLLSPEFLSKALHVTLMSVMAESLDLERLTIKNTFEAVNKDMSDENNPYSKEVIETVLSKFGIKNNGDDSHVEGWRLNRQEIAVWYGIRALKKYASRTSMALEEFLVKWKSTFPPFSPFSIDIKMLRGWYYQPALTNIQYVSKDTLPQDAKDRFKMLFKLQSQWDLDNIAAFVEELNVKGLKIDNFIMKYARKKRVGKRNIVSGR